MFVPTGGSLPPSTALDQPGAVRAARRRGDRARRASAAAASGSATRHRHAHRRSLARWRSASSHRSPWPTRWPTASTPSCTSGSDGAPPCRIPPAWLLAAPLASRRSAWPLGARQPLMDNRPKTPWPSVRVGRPRSTARPTSSSTPPGSSASRRASRRCKRTRSSPLASAEPEPERRRRARRLALLPPGAPDLPGRQAHCRPRRRGRGRGADAHRLRPARAHRRARRQAVPPSRRRPRATHAAVTRCVTALQRERHQLA